MKHLPNKLIAACTFVLFSLSTALAVSLPNDSEKEIRAVIQSQQEAWNRGDLEGFMNGYWRSEKTAFVTGGDVARGWQTVLDHYKTKYSDREKMGTLTFSDFEVTLLGPDSALILGSWKLDLKNGGPHGKTTLIFRHVAEGWRIVHDHSSAAAQ